MARTATLDSGTRVLAVLLHLMRADFAHGCSPTEIGKECGISPSAMTRCLATLEASGCMERIPETGRVRPSVRFAQYAAGILASLDATARRCEELQRRITTDIK